MGIVKTKVDQVHLADVVHHGTQIVLPSDPDMPYAVARDILTRMERLEEEVYAITHTFECFVWDGAYALQKAIEKVFGFGFGKAEMSFFGTNPPQLVEIATGPKPQDRVKVPWGMLTLPNVSGTLYTSGGVENGKFVFRLTAEVKRKHEAQIKRLAEEIQHFLDTESIYRGKAIKVSFKENPNPRTGESTPNVPVFVDLPEIDESRLILNDEVFDAVAVSLFTPLDRLAQLRARGKSKKRGVLLAGSYGTGKTLTCTIAANKAVKAGITVLMCEDADEFAQTVEFAKLLQPALVDCEDIDRVLKGERNVSVDAILNTVDGIESKNTEVFILLTTNNPDAIQEAARRPGRLDAMIKFGRPDVKATARLIHLYAKGSIDPNADVTAAAEKLVGNSPAVIEEAVSRSELAQMRIDPDNLAITSEAILKAANSMKNQLDWVNSKRAVEPTQLERAANIIGTQISNGLAAAMTVADKHVSRETTDALSQPLNGKANGKLRFTESD
jgi:transitional endoplasmic reticulum ATPase